MKIIDQSHSIISLPPNLLQDIELAGRTCYKSEDKIGCTIPDEQQGPENCPDDILNKMQGPKYFGACEASCPHHSSIKFVKMLRERGHHAMIEFGDIIVRFITNRGVTHELVRHRLCSFAQESTRYVKYDGKMEFIKPVWWEWCNSLSKQIWAETMEGLEMRYKALLDQGWRAEQAREVLPNSLKTEIVVKGNIREWRHMLTLRTSKKAHPQIRALMLPLLTELQKKIPVVFDDI